MGKFTSLFVYIVCSVGCSYQIYDILQKYLEYKTSTKVTIESDEFITMPDITLCIPYLYIVDENVLRKQTGKTLNLGPGIMAERQFLGNLTLKQIFEMTPKDDIIQECHIVKNDSIDIKQYTGKECLVNFQTQKFVIQNFMCYLFSLKNFSHEKVDTQ